MVDAIVLNMWLKMIAFENRLQALGLDRIAVAQDVFRQLLTLQNADELRHRLAFGDKPPNAVGGSEADEELRGNNDDLALIILAESISSARENRPDADGLALVEWLMLVGQYGNKSNLFRAHSKLLQGLFYHSDNQYREAKASFEESLQCYGYEPDDEGRGPASICFCCLGAISVDRDEFDTATDFFRRAKESAEEFKPPNSSWLEYIECEIKETTTQQLVVDELAKASSEESVRELAGQNDKIVNDRTIKILRSRAFQTAFRGEATDAVAVARAADWLAKSLGKESHIRLDLAEAAMYVNEYATAEVVLHALLAESPDDVKVQKNLGRSLFMQGKDEEAKGILEKLVERSPHDPQVLRDLGVVHLHLNQPGVARGYLKAALVEDPSDFLAKKALEQVGESDEPPAVAFDKESGTLTISEELLNNPDVDLNMMIAVTLLRANPEHAQEILQDIAQNKSPAYAQNVFELAFPETVKETEPGHYDKAEELFRARRVPEALKEYELAIAANRDDASAYMGAGDCYYFLGKLNLATAFFEESIAIEPSPSTWRFLGDAHRKAGRVEEGIRAYEKALELDPTYEIARQQLRMIRESIREK